MESIYINHSHISVISYAKSPEDLQRIPTIHSTRSRLFSVVEGAQFIPEIGEEVMVGFEMDNAEKPYIIGALYNGGKGKPDEEWAASKDDDGTNTVKAIRTRNGHTIEIHDKGNDGYIRIYDNKKENYILTLSTDEKLIKLESTGNIELYAKNDICPNNRKVPTKSNYHFPCCLRSSSRSAEYM